jgi:hypothetical protein
MTKPVISSLSQIMDLDLQPYERYIPSAFTNGLSQLEKMNLIIKTLADMGKLTNSLVTQWNEVMEWVMADGLTQAVSDKLDQLVADGLLDEMWTSIQNTVDIRTNNDRYVEEFGAIGDGIADDTVAIQKAIDDCSANKRNLRFTAGKTYLITSQLLVTAQSSIFGDEAHRPVIRIKSQTFDPIQVQGTYVTQTIVTANATVNTKYVDVGNATGIKAGMLVELMSSLSWYHDPRDESSDARKAELHRVSEVKGNRIYFNDPLFDGYDLTKESVTITAYTAIRFHMENIDILMDRGTEPNDDVRKTGIRLKWTTDSTLKNVFVTNAVNCGIELFHSYRPTVDGGRTTGANNYFAGYGLQTYGTTHAVIKNFHTRNCRRGVDISGGNIPSHFTTVEGCSIFADGLNSLLDRYTYNDDHSAGTYSGGIGTHGPADHTFIRNNYMGFLHTGVINRGRNTVVDGNYFIGDFYVNCIDVSFGLNIEIKNNHVYDGFTGNKENLISDGGANYNTRKAPHFVRFQYTALAYGANGSFVSIKNNFAMVQDAFITLYAPLSETSIPNQTNWVVEDNHVIFTPAFSSGNASFVRKDANNVGSVLLSGSIFKGNTHKRTNDSGTGYFKFYDGVDIRHKSQTQGGSTYTFYMNDDTSESIYFGGELSPYAVVLVTCAGATGMLKLSRGLAGGTSIGTLVNVAGQGVALAGTTGTDGMLNVAFTSDGRLHVENRLGSTQRVLITLMNWA